MKKYIVLILFILALIYLLYPLSKLETVEISLLGGAREVSGSSFLIDTNVKDFLIDCGLFYPENKKISYDKDKKNTYTRNANLDVDPESISHIILSHAHLDHIGKVPLMVKKGFKGDIILTEKTSEISLVMFENMILKNGNFGNETMTKKSNDSNIYHTHLLCDYRKKISNPIDAQINRSHLEYPNRVCKKCLRLELNDIEELYEVIDYNSKYEIIDGVNLELYNAKHIPGSASILLTFKLRDNIQSVYFSGDVGSGIDNIQKGFPDHPNGVDYIFMESTYAGHCRDLPDDPFIEFYKSVNNAIKNNKRIWIPSFVLDRTQKILHQIKLGHEKGFIENLTSIYLLSSSAKKINKVYDKYYDFRTESENEDFNMSVDNTQYLDEFPSIIITPSYVDEMNWFHPIIKEIISDNNSNIFLVGYQDPRSFGGILKNIATNNKIKLGKDYIKVRANVEYLGGGFSGHADENGILEYISKVNVKNGIILTHGDYDNMPLLQGRIKNELNIDCLMPNYNWKLNLK